MRATYNKQNLKDTVVLSNRSESINKPSVLCYWHHAGGRRRVKIRQTLTSPPHEDPNGLKKS